MKRAYLVDLLSEEWTTPAGGQQARPAGQAGGEGARGEMAVRESPLAFAVALIRHARRSRGIGAPIRRVA